MPAKTERQRRFFGAELGRLRAGLKTVTGLPEEELRKMARKNPGLASMALTPAEAKERAEPTALAEQPKYPYGLSVRLGEECLNKLDIGGVPKGGDTMLLVARVKVTSVSQRETQDGGVDRDVDLQITDMDLRDEEDETEGKAPEEKLYG